MLRVRDHFAQMFIEMFTGMFRMTKATSVTSSTFYVAHQTLLPEPDDYYEVSRSFFMILLTSNDLEAFRRCADAHTIRSY